MEWRVARDRLGVPLTHAYLVADPRYRVSFIPRPGRSMLYAPMFSPSPDGEPLLLAQGQEDPEQAKAICERHRERSRR